MGVRRRGRIIAFQAIYGWEFTRAPIDEIVGFHWLRSDTAPPESIEAGGAVPLSGYSPELSTGVKPPSEEDEKELTFPRLLVAGTIDNIEEIDQTIRNQLEHWDFNRVIKVDLAILRMSVYALLYQPDIPASVTIDEAIDIAKAFGTDESYKFVNGVLDGIRKNRCTGSANSSV